MRTYRLYWKKNVNFKLGFEFGKSLHWWFFEVNCLFWSLVLINTKVDESQWKRIRWMGQAT